MRRRGLYKLDRESGLRNALKLMHKMRGLNVLSFCRKLAAYDIGYLRENIQKIIGPVETNGKSIYWLYVPYVLHNFRVELEKDVTDPTRIALIQLLQNYVNREGPVYLDWSTIPDAGLGLFASRDILYIPGNDSNNRLTPYGGVYGDLSLDADEAYTVNPQLGDAEEYDYVLDGKTFFYLNELGRWANDGPKNAELVISLEPNQELTNRPYSVWLCATKNIKKGEEIFIKYGKKYWDSYGPSLKRKKKCIECDIRSARFRVENELNEVYCSRKCFNLHYSK